MDDSMICLICFFLLVQHDTHGRTNQQTDAPHQAIERDSGDDKLRWDELKLCVEVLYFLTFSKKTHHVHAYCVRAVGRRMMVELVAVEMMDEKVQNLVEGDSCSWRGNR